MNMEQLRWLHVIAAALHLVQGVAILVLASDFALQVTRFFWNDAPNNRLDIARLDQTGPTAMARLAMIHCQPSNFRVVSARPAPCIRATEGARPRWPRPDSTTPCRRTSHPGRVSLWVQLRLRKLSQLRK